MGKVFSFAFLQIVKNKTFIVLTLLCGILMLFMTPFMIYISGDIDTVKETSIEKVYIIDDNEILEKDYFKEKKNPFKDVDVKNLPSYKDVKIVLLNKDIKKYKKEFEKDKDNNKSLLIHAKHKLNTYVLDVYKQKECKLSDNDVSTFSSAISTLYNDIRIDKLKLDNNQQKLIDTDIEVKVTREGQSNNDKTANNTIISIVMFVVVFFIVLCGENISTAIVTEKSTKLVEFLLVNVKPLPLVCGKILASVCVSIIQLGVMIGAGTASIFVSKRLGIITSVDDTLRLLNIKGIVDNVDGVDIVMIIAFILIGFVFYAIIATMLASTVSRLEDLGSINMIFSIIILISVYAMIAVINFVDESSIIDEILIMVPFTSSFIAPSYIMLDKLTTSYYVYSIIVQLILTAIFGICASKLYISLIMHNGTLFRRHKKMEDNYE